MGFNIDMNERVILEIKNRLEKDLNKLLGVESQLKVDFKNTKPSYIEFKVVCGKYEKLITKWNMIEMPGCCGILISTGVRVEESFRRKGVNTLVNKYRIEMAKALNYGLLLCTDVDHNKAQIKTLNRNKWNKLFSFINPKTNNKVNIHAIETNPPKGWFKKLIDYIIL